MEERAGPGGQGRPVSQRPRPLLPSEAARPGGGGPQAPSLQRVGGGGWLGDCYQSK